MPSAYASHCEDLPVVLSDRNMELGAAHLQEAPGFAVLVRGLQRVFGNALFPELEHRE